MSKLFRYHLNEPSLGSFGALNAKLQSVKHAAFIFGTPGTITVFERLCAIVQSCQV